MNWLPRGTSLGLLTAGETFIFYDGPRVFSCKSLTDQWYIAALVEEGTSRDLWLYVPVSSSRLAMIRSGGLPLRAAFTHPENSLFLVTISHDESMPDTAEPIEPEALDEFQLPDEAFRLELPTHTLSLAENPLDIQRKAAQEGRTRLRLRLNLPTRTRTEAPTRTVGHLLTLTQNVYDNIGAALLYTNSPQKGQLPTEATQETASEVLYISAASFVIEIGAARGYDLFGDSVFSRVSRKIFDLFDDSTDRQQLVDSLVALRPRAAKSFRNFVRGLASSEGNITIAAAGEDFPYMQRELPLQRLQNLVGLLNVIIHEEVTEIRGLMKLYSLNTDRMTFGLRDEREDRTYEGKVDERAALQVAHATLSDLYAVVILSHDVYDEAVGEKRPRFVLQQLLPIDSDYSVEPTAIVILESPDDVDRPPF